MPSSNATIPATCASVGGDIAWACPKVAFLTVDHVQIDPRTGRAISGNIMWDGREPTLEQQAIDGKVPRIGRAEFRLNA